MEIIKLNTDNFDNIVFEDNKTVLVDFYADWCGPCKMLAPVLEDLASDNNDIIIGKLDVDQYTSLAERFNVYSIPTLMIVKNKKILKIEPGFKTKEMLNEFINV
ncbi:MAG: thioredoxin [Bacilli bacterium]|nr:thioredoxin [Bacilli bacterium]